jgi:hypothetical protein
MRHCASSFFTADAIIRLSSQRFSRLASGAFHKTVSNRIFRTFAGTSKLILKNDMIPFLSTNQVFANSSPAFSEI